jgi:hypothetical protein
VDRCEHRAPQNLKNFVGDICAAPIREYTIRKIIKTEFLFPRVFIDFYYCVSRRTHSHQKMPTKYGRFFICSNMADFRDVFRMFCGDNILYVYRVRQNTLFFQNYIQCRFFNWRLPV